MDWWPSCNMGIQSLSWPFSTSGDRGWTKSSKRFKISTTLLQCLEGILESIKIGCPAKMSWFYERLISPLTYQVYLVQVGTSMSEKWGIDLPFYCHSRLARCSVQTFRIVDPGPKIFRLPNWPNPSSCLQGHVAYRDETVFQDLADAHLRHDDVEILHIASHGKHGKWM